MRALFLVIFLGISGMVLGNTKSVDSQFLDYEKLEIKMPVKKEAKVKQTEATIAYEFYYTIDWLYSETPFSYKLEVYA